MRELCFALLLTFSFSGAKWETDFHKAEQIAAAEHKNILLSFGGSDWCAPCIRLHKEIFDNREFVDYSNEHLVLVRADFPRLKKNQLSMDQQKKNEQLAEIYNKDGKFPFTLLLNSDGKVLRTWDGYPKITPSEFVSQVKESSNGSN